MAKMVTYQGKFSAVVRSGDDDLPSYDVWQWSLKKQKWVRLSQTACGFGSTADAKPVCDEIDKETHDLLQAAKSAPPPLR